MPFIIIFFGGEGDENAEMPYFVGLQHSASLLSEKKKVPEHYHKNWVGNLVSIFFWFIQLRVYICFFKSSQIYKLILLLNNKLPIHLCT